MARAKKFFEAMHTLLYPGTLSRIDEARREDETRADLVRKAIEREVRRRPQKEDKR